MMAAWIKMKDCVIISFIQDSSDKNSEVRFWLQLGNSGYDDLETFEKNILNNLLYKHFKNSP